MTGIWTQYHVIHRPVTYPPDHYTYTTRTNFIPGYAKHLMCMLVYNQMWKTFFTHVKKLSYLITWSLYLEVISIFPFNHISLYLTFLMLTVCGWNPLLWTLTMIWSLGILTTTLLSTALLLCSYYSGGKILIKSVIYYMHLKITLV